MSNYQSGHDAEERAVDYLAKLKFVIHARNWKTQYCEIDIVAEKAKRIYLVEVKYRSTKAQGSGYEYVTPKKLKQMQFAAQMWVSHHKWAGEYQLAVISIDGDRYTFIDNITT